MSLAYLILTHQKPQQFARLFDAIYHPADHFAVHVDRKAPLAVREAMSRWDKPALVMFSDSDPVFSPRAGERFAELIPGAGPAETIEGAGHFLQEDAGERIADRIVTFVRSGR